MSCDDTRNLLYVASERVCELGSEEHGHTDCWLISGLLAECRKLAELLMSEYTWTHEHKIEEVDEALKPYLGV